MPETYSATEDEGGAPPSTATPQAAALTPIADAASSAQLRLAQTFVRPPAAPATPRLNEYPHAAPTARYDAIPSDQMEPMLKRIALVSQIAEKYARAYDYRTHTTSELEAILHDLDGKNAPQIDVPNRPEPGAPQAAREVRDQGSPQAARDMIDNGAVAQ